MIGKGFKTIITGLLLVLLILGIAYVVACSVGNYQAFTGSDSSLKDIDDARYKIRIRSSGNILLTNDLKRDGDILILNGHWRLDRKGAFKYRETVFLLNTKIYGEPEIVDRD